MHNGVTRAVRQVGDGFVEGKGILENYEGHDMFIVSGSGSGTGISVTGPPRERGWGGGG